MSSLLYGARFSRQALSPGAPLSSEESAQGLAQTLAIPVRGGAPRRICAFRCPATWSPDGRFFLLGVGPTGAPDWTVAIPVPPGKSLPDLPASGISTTDDAVKLAGARMIEQGAVAPGPTLSTYVFQKVGLRRNLFRIDLR